MGETDGAAVFRIFLCRLSVSYLREVFSNSDVLICYCSLYVNFDFEKSSVNSSFKIITFSSFQFFLYQEQSFKYIQCSQNSPQNSNK